MDEEMNLGIPLYATSVTGRQDPDILLMPENPWLGSHGIAAFELHECHRRLYKSRLTSPWVVYVAAISGADHHCSFVHGFLVYIYAIRATS